MPLDRVRGAVAASGVYYGWVVAGACFLGSLALFGTTYSFGVVAAALVRAFDSSPATVAAVFGVQTAVLYLASPVVGLAVDRVGERRVLAAGAVVLATGLAGASASRSLLWLGLTYGAVVGLGLSAVYVVAYSTVPKWFGRRRGAANGLATAGLGAGLLLVPPATARLLTAVGWRDTFRVLAAGTAGLLAVVVLLFADDPADVDADVEREFPDGRAEASAGSWREQVRAVRGTVRRPAFLAVVAGWVGVYATLYVLLGHVVLYTTHAGMGRAVGVRAIATVGVVTSGARVGLGVVSDRVGRVRLFLACAATMAATVAALSLVATPTGVLALAVVFGLGYGGAGSLLSPLVADLFGTENLTALYGTMSVAFAASGLLAPPAAGVVFEATGTYAPAFLAAGAAGLVGTGFVALGSQLARRES